MNDTLTDGFDWALWFYWIMATTLGWLIGNLFFRGLPVIIAGVLIAALQWSVLNKRIPKAWRWFVFSALGWMLGFISFQVFMPDLPLLVGPVLGALVGVGQWLVLRNHFDWAGWWLVISPLAWTTGLTVMPGVLTSGTLPGALTGLALVVFFGFSIKRKGIEAK